MKQSATTTGTFLTVISALSFSALSIFGVMAYRAGANLVTSQGFRFLIAALVLWVALLVRRIPLPRGKTALQLLLMGGVGYVTQATLFFSSIDQDRLSPALAGLLLYTYPALVTLLAWFSEGQRPTSEQFFALTLTLAGVALVLLVPGAAARFTGAGAAFALASALFYSFFIIISNRVLRQSRPDVATAYIATGAATVFLSFGALSGRLVSVAPLGWGAIVGMGVIATVMALMLFFAGMARLGPTRASIISTLEPVGTVLLSTLLLGDRLSLGQLAGGALVLIGVLWIQRGRPASSESQNSGSDR